MSSNLYKIATCTVFDWFSQNLAHMICLSIRKKNCGTYFRNLDFKNFGLSLSNSNSGFIWTDRPPLVVCFHIFFNYSQLFALRSVYCVFSVFWGNILLIASEVLAIISGVWHQTQLTHLVNSLTHVSDVSVNDNADLDMVQRAAVFACVGTAGQRCTTTRRIVSMPR